MIVLDTVVHRWYAFGFVIFLLWSASKEGGWKQAVRFLAIAFVVQLAAELSSTRIGVPFGRYSYISHVRELRISNVPLFVPLTFGVVVWAGRQLATLIVRGRFAIALTGAVFAAILDLAIDPMTLRGSTWFLGSLYRYRSSSWYFGVPWSNTAGWILASAVILLVDASFRKADPRNHLDELLLTAAIILFFLALALVTRHFAIAGAELAIVFVMACAVLVSRQRAGVAAS
ncbi:MAG: carotenoid biosynthesis protein [Actinomycetota bacterium]